MQERSEKKHLLRKYLMSGVDKGEKLYADGLEQCN